MCAQSTRGKLWGPIMDIKNGETLEKNEYPKASSKFLTWASVASDLVFVVVNNMNACGDANEFAITFCRISIFPILFWRMNGIEFVQRLPLMNTCNALPSCINSEWKLNARMPCVWATPFFASLEFDHFVFRFSHWMAICLMYLSLCVAVSLNSYRWIGIWIDCLVRRLHFPVDGILFTVLDWIVRRIVQ